MKCDDLLALLNDYVDGDVAAGLCADLERHLAGCNPCQVVVDNIRQTITLYKAGQPFELPVGLHERLQAAWRQRWNATHPVPPETAASGCPEAGT
jgi:anti-sigma factor RsiW